MVGLAVNASDLATRAWVRAWSTISNGWCRFVEGKRRASDEVLMGLRVGDTTVALRMDWPKICFFYVVFFESLSSSEIMRCFIAIVVTSS